MNQIQNTSRSRRRWLAILLWGVFCAGLLVEASAPHLKIRDGGFVIPQTLTSGRGVVRPDELVDRERKMQLISLLLTVGGALALAFNYRRVLWGPVRPK
jgi:hypothetical protein